MFLRPSCLFGRWTLVLYFVSIKLPHVTAVFVVQKNKREYIKRALARLDSIVNGCGGKCQTQRRGKISFFKALSQYKTSEASKSLALCVKKNCASGNLQSLDELLETSDDATAGWDCG